MIEMAIKDDITWRTIIVYVFIVLFGCLILAKACAVMTVEGEISGQPTVGFWRPRFLFMNSVSILLQ